MWGIARIKGTRLARNSRSQSFFLGSLREGNRSSFWLLLYQKKLVRSNWGPVYYVRIRMGVGMRPSSRWSSFTERVPWKGGNRRFTGIENLLWSLTWFVKYILKMTLHDSIPFIHELSLLLKSYQFSSNNSKR